MVIGGAEGLVGTAGGGVARLQRGSPISPLISPLRRSSQARAAWPWANPAVDIVQRPRQPPDQASFQRLRPKLDLAGLMKRSEKGDGRRESHDDRTAGERGTWLPNPPSVPRARAVHNAAALAYVGDAIFELYARRHILSPPQTMENYSRRVMALVCCEAQHAFLRKLVADKTFLTEVEKEILRWGRNVDTGNRGARRRAGGVVYNGASSLETLIGYLYLTNPQRLEDVMERMGFDSKIGQ